MFVIDVEGTGFLYNQVRNMVGTLIEIGRGHWEPAYAAEVLAGCDRSKGGPTAPARGLCLQWVRYDLTRPAESYVRPWFDRAADSKAGAPESAPPEARRAAADIESEVE
jgi:tRNA U38,U39,U40 pseudouridine synthase TruA